MRWLKPNGRGVRRQALTAVVALVVCAGAVGGQAGAVRAAAVIQGSCYDAYYFDGLSSRYASGGCASALNSAGYAGAAFSNATAASALQRAPLDAVFFHAGHSIDFYQPGSTAHSGVGLVYEGPNSSSDIDILAGDPIYAAQLTGAEATICAAGGGCRTQLVLTSYPWGDLPSHAVSNLVVLEGCATAQDTTTDVSIARIVYNTGAGTVVGFSQDVSFPTNADNTNLYGDGWANRFWSDAGAGYSYTSAVIDASNSVGNAYGLGSWVVLQNPGAPQSLYPAKYFAV
ncbi:MAG TPA: hypothetical protein VGQ42_16425 [Candidatus Dormibacteraeota bacterium]|jgi:hypothetical protein|nr:hypothetical protein [Candidatus Dormibacteraeota bacterium]